VALTIETRRESGGIVLILNGRITLGEGSQILRATLRELLENGTKSLHLNLGGVSLIDSSGLAELTSAYINAKKHNATLTLTNLDWNLQRLFEMTRLSTIFHIEEPTQPVESI
jgi:anti-sigma B factor antagonist